MTARTTIALVAWREIHERLRSRIFLVSTVLMLALVGGSTALNGALTRTQTYRIAVTAPIPVGLGTALQHAAEPFDAKIRYESAPSAKAGGERLRAKKVDALLLPATDRIVFRAGVDTKLAAIADTAVRAVRNHLPPRPELTAATLEPGSKATSDAATAVAYIGSLLLLMTLAVYGQWVLTGVVEEKSNRVVEVILATVRPRDLLAGKVLGIGLLGLGQIALVGGLASVLLGAGVC